MLSEANVGFYNAVKLYPSTWASTTAYTVGDLIKASSYNSHTYLCTVAGTTASTEPAWPTTNDTTKTDGTVTWTCKDTKCYQVKAPQNSVTPYITFGMETEVPIGDFSDFETIASMAYWINCFSSKSTADVAGIADDVCSALDNANLSVSGYTNLKCVREFTGNVMWDNETGIYQVPLRYRVWNNKS